MTTKIKELNFSKAMWSMALIMVVGGVIWRPFYTFNIFPSNASEHLRIFLDLIGNILKTVPAFFLISYYKESLSCSLKDMLSFKFNYKVFFTFLGIVLAFFVGLAFVFHGGKFSFNTKNIGIYNIINTVVSSLCQELVFRGWCYYAFYSASSRKTAIILSSFFASSNVMLSYFWSFCETGAFSFFAFLQNTIFAFVFGLAMCFVLIKCKSKSVIPRVILSLAWLYLYEILISSSGHN